MIRAPRRFGAAFSESADGDIQRDLSARASLSVALGVTSEWAVARQVHGARVAAVHRAGAAGDADALWTAARGLPLAVFTADCHGVVLKAATAVGVAHAGWRGIAAGVLEELRLEMTAAGHAPTTAAVGPGIGACCFEVGPEVVARFPSDASATSQGADSVDLAGAVVKRLSGLDIWASGRCTAHEAGSFSHRRTGATERMAAVGWLT